MNLFLDYTVSIKKKLFLIFFFSGSVGTNKVYLNVEELPSVKVLPDALTFLKDDSDISLQCLLTGGSPFPSIDWFKNGYLLTVCIIF